MKTRNLAAEATTWALEQSASTAKTEKGIIKAVDKWLTGRDLVSTYLDALQASASAVMSADLKHRAEITAERKSILKIPAYARARFATTAEV